LKRGKAALSVVISSIIMTSTLLMVSLIAFNLSINILSAQVQRSDFEEAKNDILLLADVVEDTSLKPKSSGYVSFNSRAGRFSFVHNQYQIEVNVSGGSTVNLLKGTLGSLKYQGGLEVGTVQSRYLRGSNSCLVEDPVRPLALVYTEYNSAPYIILESRRVRVIELGTFYFYDKGDGNSGYLNMVEVTFLNVTFGEIYYSNPLNVKASNRQISVSFHILNQTDLLFSVKIGDENITKTVQGPVTFEGNPVSGTLVRVVTIEVVISSVWGE